MSRIEFDAGQVDFAKSGGLVPAIVQSVQTGEVLMLGYMNREALDHTLKTGSVTFFSRSKERLWTKGETSGHTLELVSVALDCDRDTLLVQARANGPTCHTGTRSCFGETPGPELAFFGELEAVIAQRADANPDDSYTARLLGKGMLKVAQKVGEEGVETALAATNEDDDALLGEASDLVFHLLVLLRARGLSLADVSRTLQGRHRGKA